MKRKSGVRARAFGALLTLLLPACGLVLGIEDLRAPPSDAGAGVDHDGAETSDDDGGCRELETSCASDDDNCAYCGHRCGAGSHCVEHTCTPVEVRTFVTPFYGPGCALARDGARLFVATAEALDAGAHTVVREILDDGGIAPQPAAVAEQLARPTALAIDGERFYLLGLADAASPWQSIVSCPRDGGACTTHATSDSTRYFRSFARSAAGLFATDTTGRTVWQIPLSPDSGLSVLVHDELYLPWDVVADDDAVYWSGQHPTSPDASLPLWRVMRLAGGADAATAADAAPVLVERNDLNGLALDGAELVFGVDGGLGRIAKNGGAITGVPIRDSARVSFAAADDRSWFAFVTTTNGEWSLYERSRCGAKALAIARLDVEPANAATLGSSVYVCTMGAPLYKPPTLLRIAR